MAVRGLFNNYSSKLDGSISNSATTFDVLNATGISSALASSDYVPLTIDDGTNVEIVYCTGVSTNTLTVTRGREGTSGTAFSDLTRIECRLTEEAYREAGGWELVDAQVLSGNVTEVEFLVSSGSYKLIVDAMNVGGVSDPEITLQQATTGPSYSSSNYSQVRNHLNSSGNTPDSAGSQSAITLITDANRNSAARISGEIYVDRVDESITHSFRYNLVAPGEIWSGVGWRTTAEAIVAFKIVSSLASGIESGSAFYLYKFKG